jgi:nitrite reductase (NADH) large subunit
MAIVDSHDDVIRLTGRFMQWYREHARYLERTYDFVERVGIEHIRSVVVDDGAGDHARLDAEMERTVQAYVDPWSEAERPIHPTQFARALEPVEATHHDGRDEREITPVATLPRAVGMK